VAAASWVVEVDWRNDGDFAGVGEVVTTRVLNDPGLAFERGRDQVRELAPPMAGRCAFALNNASQDYSPEYAAGPLYGNLLPGRLMRLRTTAPSAATLWAGITDDLAQAPFINGGGRVHISALGYLSRLKGTPVWIDVQENITTSAALTLLLEAVALVEGEHFDILDTGQTTLTAWWCAGDDAFDMLRRLLAAEGPGAAIYEQAHGRIAFHSRHYRLLTARSTTSQVTFGDATTEPKHSLPFSYDPNLKDVVNSAALDTATLRFASTLSLLAAWEFDAPATFSPGESRDYVFRLDAPATDFDADLIIPVFFAHSLSYSAGYGPTVTVTVTSASAGAASFTGIELYGKRLEPGTARIEQTVDASASRISYGVRGVPGSFSPWPYLTESAALDLVNSVVVAYQQPRATVSVTIANANSTRLTQQLTREISDRVTVVESQTGLNAAMFVERIRHEVREGGRFHRTTFGCEQVGPHDDYFLFDADNFDDEAFGF
jgi:hypothetical protein